MSYGNSTNPTWDWWLLCVLGFMETGTGYVCVCMPTMRLMLVRFYPPLRDRWHRLTGHGDSVLRRRAGPREFVHLVNPRVIMHSTTYTVTIVPSPEAADLQSIENAAGEVIAGQKA